MLILCKLPSYLVFACNTSHSFYVVMHKISKVPRFLDLNGNENISNAPPTVDRRRIT